MTAPRTSEAPSLRANACLVRLAKVEDPSVAELGGKAASLVRLARAGFRVPDGAVLPASWFSPWWAELEGSEAWSLFLATHEAPWAAHCEALKSAARGIWIPTSRASGGRSARAVSLPAMPGLMSMSSGGSITTVTG